MDKNFKYSTVIKKENDIQVEDIGNCAILANDDLTKTWCIIVKTVSGWTEVFEFGPVFPDIYDLPNSVKFVYSRFPYKEASVSRAIDKFLNRSDANITQAVQVTPEEAKSIIRNLGDYIDDKRND